MFHCLTSSLLSSTSTHLSQVQLENITLQQLTCFASHSSSLPRTKFILGSCHDKNTWNTRQRYLDECRPYQADIEKCFRTSVQFPHKATPSVRNSGSVSPLPRANPAESASWKARQWGVSSRITAPLDTWQMKMRQQERTRIVQSLYIHHMLSNHSPPVFLKMESMKPIFHSPYKVHNSLVHCRGSTRYTKPNHCRCHF